MTHFDHGRGRDPGARPRSEHDRPRERSPRGRSPDLAALQRTVGNRAVAALLGAPGCAGPRAVQRTDNSAKLLKEMATPKVFEGPAVAAQERIVAGLEEVISKMEPDKQKELQLSCIGGIELSDPGLGKLDDLIKGAKLIDLYGGIMKVNTYDIAIGAKVDGDVIINTLTTMERAGQLDYLRESGLINDKWKVIVEVHYYRDRDTTQTKFHKDTAGETLFVNLSFVNKQKSAGPEYIVNPPSTKSYDNFVAVNLPPVFVDDLNKVKDDLDRPKEIGMTVLPEHGVVAFVDEIMHHKTPTLAHRTASLGAIKFALSTRFKADYPKACKAYAKCKADLGKAAKAKPRKKGGYEALDDDVPKPFAKRFKQPTSGTVAEWYVVMTGLDVADDTRYDRKQLAASFPAGFLDVEVLIEQGGSIDFGQASLHQGRFVLPIREKTDAVLTRRMSQELLAGTAPTPIPGRRTFFRTWVRAVPRVRP